MVLQYMPVVFLFVYTLNQVLREDEETFVVLFLGVVMDSFLMMPVERSFSSTHLVSLIIVILVYLGSGWMKDNKRFVENTLSLSGRFYMRAGFR